MGTNGIDPEYPHEGGWTEENEGNEPYDRRGVGSNGPFTLEAGEMVTFNLAFIWSRGEEGAYSSVEKLKSEIPIVRQWFENQEFPSNYSMDVVKAEEFVDCEKELFSLLPNPAKDHVILKLNNQDNAMYSITDLNGRIHRIAVLNERYNEIHISGFAPGIYIITVYQDGVSYRQRLIIQ